MPVAGERRPVVDGIAGMPAWKLNGACATPDVNPGLFYKGGHYTQAKSVCARCTVRAECLDAAMDDEGGSPVFLRFGVWGGMTPAERRRHWVETHADADGEVTA